MSLINNVLSGLKKRGAKALPAEKAAPDEAVIKANPPKNRIKEALIGSAALVALVSVSAAGWWWYTKHKATVPVKVAQAPAKPISAPQAVPPVAPVVAAQAEASGVVMSEPVAASQPVTQMAQEAAPKAAEAKLVEQKVAEPKVNEPKESVTGEHGQPLETASTARPVEEVGGAAPREHVKPPAQTRVQKRRKTGSSVAHDAGSSEGEIAPEVAPAAEGTVEKQVKPLSLRQQAENEFRKANGLMQQGRSEDALNGYEAALKLDAGHDQARQALVGLLLEKKRNADAERVLQDGLKVNIKNSRFAMLLARIQIDRDASWSALLVLQKTLPYAEQQADYQAFIAALLQRLNHHKEAVAHYQVAVQISPSSGVWWMGLGISLRALQRNDEAYDAFKHALESNSLSADLQTFVRQQLKELQNPPR